MTTRTAAEALEKLIRLERNLEKKCHDLGYYNMIHVGLREFVEHAETFRAALAPPQEGEPTITVSGPVACGKSFVMELIYKALRDAGLHPYSDDLAHERRMVEEQPQPPAKVWKLREAVYAAPPQAAPAQEPVATLEAKVSTLLARALTTGYGSTEAIYALANLAREPLFAAPPPDEAGELLEELSRRTAMMGDMADRAVHERIRAYLEKHK